MNLKIFYNYYNENKYWMNNRVNHRVILFNKYIPQS